MCHLLLCVCLCTLCAQVRRAFVTRTSVCVCCVSPIAPSTSLCLCCLSARAVCTGRRSAAWNDNTSHAVS